MDDPLDGLSGTERQQALEAVAAKARKDFDACVAQLTAAVRRFNPMQLLAHFAYYDQIHLHDSESKHGYDQAGQSMVEWLQALVLQVPETSVQDVLEQSPVGTQLHDVNKALNTAQECYGLMRLANKAGPDPVGMAAELIRQHTAFVRNEGYGWQLQRLHREIFRPLDAEFRNREGVSFSDVANFLWAALETVQKRLNEDWRQRRKIISQGSAKGVITEFAELIKQAPEKVRGDMAEFAHDIEKVRFAVMNWLDERNFRLFYLVIKHQGRKELHELVKDRMQRAVETHGVKRAIVIATSAVERTYPYLGVYFHCAEMESDELGQAFTPGILLN